MVRGRHDLPTPSWRARLACWWHGHHWRFVRQTPECKVFLCRRCGREFRAY